MNSSLGCLFLESFLFRASVELLIAKVIQCNLFQDLRVIIFFWGGGEILCCSNGEIQNTHFLY